MLWVDEWGGGGGGGGGGEGADPGVELSLARTEGMVAEVHQRCTASSAIDNTYVTCVHIYVCINIYTYVYLCLHIYMNV